MSVPVTTKDDFEPSVPKPLFRVRLREPVSGSDISSYDVSRDGQRFLINMDVDQTAAPPINVLLNWSREAAR